MGSQYGWTGLMAEDMIKMHVYLYEIVQLYSKSK